MNSLISKPKLFLAITFVFGLVLSGLFSTANYLITKEKVSAAILSSWYLGQKACLVGEPSAIQRHLSLSDNTDLNLIYRDSDRLLLGSFYFHCVADLVSARRWGDTWVAINTVNFVSHMSNEMFQDFESAFYENVEMSLQDRFSMEVSKMLEVNDDIKSLDDEINSIVTERFSILLNIVTFVFIQVVLITLAILLIKAKSSNEI